MYDKYDIKYYQSHREECKERSRIWFQGNKHRHMTYYRRNRDKLFEILGGKKCVKCGFTDERALQFDHINGGGNKECGKTSRRFMVSVWIKDPDIKNKLQVLCANCNWIKRSISS